MDIDFINDTTSGFDVLFQSHPQAATGNKLLANRFEILLLTSIKYFSTYNGYETDGSGGDLYGIITKSRSRIENTDVLAASINIAIDKTVEDLKRTTPSTAPDTEKISSANIKEFDIHGDFVTLSIDVIPVQGDGTGTTSILDIPIQNWG